MFDIFAAQLTTGGSHSLFYSMVLLPLIVAVLILIMQRTRFRARTLLMLLGTMANFLLALCLFNAPDYTMLLPWAGFGINIALRVYKTSRFFVLLASFFEFLVAVYSAAYVKNKDYKGDFMFCFMLTVALMNGVFLANNLVALLFFWECLMLVIFGMLVQTAGKNFGAAIKSIVTNGVGDCLLLLGVVTCYAQSGTLVMDAITALPLEGMGRTGFICMSLGAVAKMGAVPFHSWMPGAAHRTPLPFTALLSSALEKLMGVYLLLRVFVDFYTVPQGTLQNILLLIGAVTVIFPAAMMLIQNDMKRLLAFGNISQLGMIILCFGSASSVSRLGGLMCAVTQAVSQCAMFMAVGSVERAAGSTDLRQISGMGRHLPLTGFCFILAAFSALSFPMFGGFFSTMNVLQILFNTGKLYYVCALVGCFLLASGYFRCIHAVFFGPTKLPSGVQAKDLREAPAAMALPLMTLAALCVLLGVFNKSAVDFVQQNVDVAAEMLDCGGWNFTLPLLVSIVAVLLLAIGNHLIGFRFTGEAWRADEHFYYAPLLHQLYVGAEEHYTDPYNIFVSVQKIYALIAYCLERAINWLFDGFYVALSRSVSRNLHDANDGSMQRYVLWAVGGIALLLLLFLLMI